MAGTGRVTLREIARQTGITRMAVSLALRGKPGVSDETRHKVLQAAERLGYRPDPEVSKLLSRIRSRSPADAAACLALLTSGLTADDWKRSVTERRYVEGVRERAATYGYRVEEFWMNAPGLSPERLANILWSRGIEGVIVAPLQVKLSDRAPRVLEMDFSRFSVVEISETVEAPDLDRAIHDQYTSTLRLMEELWRLDYRAIGLVLEDALDLRVNRKWSAAYLQFRRTRGKEADRFPPPLILPDADQRAFDRWYERHRPDVLVSVDRFGLRFLQHRRAAIPREVGYATLDLDGDADAFPGMSGIDQNSRLVGASAVDLLVAAIQRGQRGVPDHPVRIEVEGSWVAGRTTAQRTPGALRKAKAALPRAAR